jgi:hypothetical protein
VFTARYELIILNMIQVNVEQKAVHAVNRRPLISEARIQSLVTPCEICDGQSGTSIGFTPSTSVSSCQYHSTNAPYSSLSTVCSYRWDKWPKPGNLTEGSALSEIGEH